MTRRKLITSPAGVVAKYCDCYVCVCVCQSARISPEPHARSLPILWMLPMAMARFSSGVVAIRYVLPVLRMLVSIKGRIAVWISLRRIAFA